MIIVFSACDLGGCSDQVWDEGARIRWTSEWISRRDAELLCGCEDHA